MPGAGLHGERAQQPAAPRTQALEARAARSRRESRGAGPYSLQYRSKLYIAGRGVCREDERCPLVTWHLRMCRHDETRGPRPAPRGPGEVPVAPVASSYMS